MSEPPRPSVVISRSVETPWNPATTQTLPTLRASRRRSPLTSRIFALPCALSVMMPTWLPVKLMASTPRSASAIQSRDIDTRSPVVSNMSISRPGCTVDTSFASFSKLSVDLPIAETTTTTPAPCCRVYATWSATARMRSGSATEVPPYFWTMSVTRSTAYGCHEPSATVSETTSNSRSDAPVATGWSGFASPDPSSVWVSRCW